MRIGRPGGVPAALRSTAAGRPYSAAHGSNAGGRNQPPAIAMRRTEEGSAVRKRAASSAETAGEKQKP